MDIDFFSLDKEDMQDFVNKFNSWEWWVKGKEENKEDNSFYMLHIRWNTHDELYSKIEEIEEDNSSWEFKTIEEATQQAISIINEYNLKPENVFVLKAVKGFKANNIIEVDL